MITYTLVLYLMLLQFILKLKREVLYFAPPSETTPLLRNPKSFEIC